MDFIIAKERGEGREICNIKTLCKRINLRFTVN